MFNNSKKQIKKVSGALNFFIFIIYLVGLSPVWGDIKPGLSIPVNDGYLLFISFLYRLNNDKISS